ncbi:hypothetical protein N7465_009742 [Penicillium sp. CMV-2018d]|nr:hypothetical protein N7465_009742 [Penicillium sp. CMV-2018d]
MAASGVYSRQLPLTPLLGDRGSINFLPLVWASIHLVLLRREVIFHPLFNASLDLLSIAVYLRIVIFLGPGLGEYVYKSITGPFMLAAMYGRNILLI